NSRPQCEAAPDESSSCGTQPANISVIHRRCRSADQLTGVHQPCTPGWLISRVCTRSAIEQPFILIPEQPFILTAVFPYQFSVGCCAESITSTSTRARGGSSLRPSCSCSAVVNSGSPSESGRRRPGVGFLANRMS